MENSKLYLKPNIVLEPLVDSWYAWSHLISPATAAMNIVGRHLKIMESYVQAPQVHAAAARNPKMMGGPFVDYDRLRVDDMKRLISWTKERRAHMIEFAGAVNQLSEMLANEAHGYSLEPLYARVPEPLQGYVELVYDLNNQPNFRLIEALLYRSPYYNPESQSLVLGEIDQDDRPFVLSTPRLVDDDEVHLEIPFHHPGIDELFRMKARPQPYGRIKEALGLNNGHEELFRSFFTDEAPKPYEPYEGAGMRWRYFGHACILLEAPGFNVLLDPVLSYTYESDVSRYTYEDLPETIHYALITHNHQDHILFETMLQLRHKVENVVVPRSNGGSLEDPSLKLLLETIGFDNVIELDEMESITTENGTITGLPFFGEHADLNIRSKLAYHCRIGDHTLMFAADSCNIEPRLYQHVSKIVGDADVLFLGMECDGAPLSWVYGPLLTHPLERKMDQERRLAGSNYSQGMPIVDSFNCKEVYVYAMGQEPWLRYVMSRIYTDESNPIVASNKLIEDCKGRGIQAERLYGEKEILLP